MIAASLLAGVGSGRAAEVCHSTPPHDVSFTSAGPQSGNLVLSLDMPSRTFVAGSKVIAVLRLQPVDDASLTLSSDLPYGDYQFNVYNLSTHRVPRDRKDHPISVSQLAFQRLSRGCPNYEDFDLNWLYNLEPGKYSVTATRRPHRVPAMQAPSNVENLPIVVSNKVYFRIDP